MENSNSDFKKLSANYGLMHGVALAILFYLTFKLNFTGSYLISFISISLTAVLVYLPIHQFKINNQNKLNLREAIKIGLIVGLIGGIIYSAYVYIHYTYIDTEYLQQIVEEIKNSNDMQGQGATPEQIESTKKSAISFLGSPFFNATGKLLGSIIKSLIAGLIIGLVKKN